MKIARKIREALNVWMSKGSNFDDKVERAFRSLPGEHQLPHDIDNDFNTLGFVIKNEIPRRKTQDHKVDSSGGIELVDQYGNRTRLYN